MPEDKPEEPETPPIEIPGAVIFGGKSVLKFKGTGKLTVRKIQTSPDADPELVFDCGFYPRCALESDDAGELRFAKICRLIRECRYGIHDLSRVELGAENQLPRFNMPLELGLFLGAKEFSENKVWIPALNAAKHSQDLFNVAHCLSSLGKWGHEAYSPRYP